MFFRKTNTQREAISGSEYLNISCAYEIVICDTEFFGTSFTRVGVGSLLIDWFMGLSEQAALVNLAIMRTTDLVPVDSQ